MVVMAVWPVRLATPELRVMRVITALAELADLEVTLVTPATLAL
jgi:hypothetical protein